MLSITYANGTEQAIPTIRWARPRQFLDANGQAIGYTYNADGLITQETFADGTSYTYTYNAQGNMTSADRRRGQRRPPSSTATRATPICLPRSNIPRHMAEFSYNVVGQRTQSVDQTGFTVNYIYDALGRLSELTDANGNLIVLYSYDAAGNLIQKDNGNGTFTIYTYDGDGDVL